MKVDMTYETKRNEMKAYEGLETNKMSAAHRGFTVLVPCESVGGGNGFTIEGRLSVAERRSLYTGLRCMPSSGP